MNFPPPWDLNGEGLIIPFIADKNYFLNSNFLSTEDKNTYQGGIGAMMLVNYESSNVGPYFELLLIPGDFKFKNKTYKRITKIFVSSEVSVREGIKNWAIPKELASFSWKTNQKQNFVEVKTDELFFKISYEKILFPFPISTSFYPVKLLQKSENEFLITKFKGNGTGKFVKIFNLEVNEKFFPDILKSSKFHFGISVSSFKIQFPVPEKLNAI